MPSGNFRKELGKPSATQLSCRTLGGAPRSRSSLCACAGVTRPRERENVPRIPSQGPPFPQNQKERASCALASAQRAPPSARLGFSRAASPLPDLPRPRAPLGGTAHRPSSRRHDHECVLTSARAGPSARRPRLSSRPAPAGLQCRALGSENPGIRARSV